MLPTFFTLIFFFWFSQNIYTPFLPAYMSKLGIAVSMIGIIVGSNGVSQMMLRIPISIIDSRTKDYRVFITIGIIATIVGLVVPLFTESAATFLFCRAITGFSVATWVSYTAYAIEGAGKDANRRMGMLLSASTGGAVVAQLVGTLVYNGQNMRTLIIMALIAIILSFLLYLTIATDESMHPSHLKQKMSKGTYVNVLKSPQLICCCILAVLNYIVLCSTNQSFVTVYAQDILGASTNQIGIMAILTQLAGLIIAMVISKFGTKPLPEKRIVITAFLLFTIYCILSAVIKNPSVTVILQIPCGVAMGTLNVILLANVGRGLSAQMQGFAGGVFQSFQGFGVTIGPIIGAQLYNLFGDYQKMFIAMAGVALLGAITTLIAYRDSEIWEKYSRAGRYMF
jgi:MFS family permease